MAPHYARTPFGVILSRDPGSDDFPRLAARAKRTALVAAVVIAAYPVMLLLRFASTQPWRGDETIVSIVVLLAVTILAAFGTGWFFRWGYTMTLMVLGWQSPWQHIELSKDHRSHPDAALAEATVQLARGVSTFDVELALRRQQYGVEEK